MFKMSWQNQRVGKVAALALLLVGCGVIGSRQALAQSGGYITVEVVWADAETRQSQTVQGELWFEEHEFPVLMRNRQGVFVEQRLHANSLAPRNPGELYLERLPDADGERPVFSLRRYRDTTVIALPQERLRVVAEGEDTAALMRTSIDDAGAMSDVTDLFGEDEEDVNELLDGGRDLRQGVRLAVKRRPDLRSIPVASLQRITFLEASEAYRFEPYRGRYVNYSSSGRGDDGRVQVVAVARWHRFPRIIVGRRCLSVTARICVACWRWFVFHGEPAWPVRFSLTTRMPCMS